MPALSRVETLELFPGLHEELLKLLGGLEVEDWRKPTACQGWSVQDVAAHILDTQLRIVSAGRDGHHLPPGGAIGSYRELVDYLNELNGEWVKAMRRVSPQVLTGMLTKSGPALAEHLATWDPDGPAPFPVAWAGETTSANWFDIGRQYTEYWHHQAQIREAVGAQGLTGRKWLWPVLALFMRGVPWAYKEVAAQAGSAVAIVIEGEAGGVWTLLRGGHGWELVEREAGDVKANVRLSDQTAWRLFTNGLTAERAAAEVMLKGNRTLAEVFLSVRSVMV